MSKVRPMPDLEFRFMVLIFHLVDLFMPYIDKRVKTFPIHEGATVVDYGCGPGRYTVRFARLVGPAGRVYAVDVHRLAVAETSRRAAKLGLTNVTSVLAHDYNSGLPDAVADVVCALDMFFSVPDPAAFLAELHRIARPGGLLIIDDGHQSRAETKRKIRESDRWRLLDETRDHLTYEPG